ncbi:MAG: SDR family NAD(P)-dependent oxidoreductase, partial [Pseudomonadota bacterium]
MANTYDLKDKVAVVTGGAQGIGHAVAQRLADNGAQVVSWDSNAAQNAAAMHGVGTAVKCDVSDWDAIQAALVVCKAAW